MAGWCVAFRIDCTAVSSESSLITEIDYEGKLTTTLEEQLDSTKLLLELEGIPKGQEDELERNLMGY